MATCCSPRSHRRRRTAQVAVAKARTKIGGRGFGSTGSVRCKGNAGGYAARIPISRAVLSCNKQSASKPKLNMTGTAGQRRVPTGYFSSIPLPPLLPSPEQLRIVEEIEKQFTRLDAAVGALRAAQAKLKRYRASVLNAAVTGKLVPTEAALARAEGRDYEHASVLLERIQRERAEQERDKPRRKRPAPAPVDASTLPELPEGWAWTRLSSIGEVRLGRQRSPKRAIGPNMRPYLRAANVTWNGLDLSDVKEMDFSAREVASYQLFENDILLSEASGSVDEVGKPAIWNGQIDGCCFQNTLIRLRLHAEIVPYVYCHLLSDARSGALGRAARGVGIHHLGAERTESWIVSLPPLAEQQRVVAELERRLSVVQQAEAGIETNLKRAERLVRPSSSVRSRDGSFPRTRTTNPPPCCWSASRRKGRQRRRSGGAGAGRGLRGLDGHRERSVGCSLTRRFPMGTDRQRQDVKDSVAMHIGVVHELRRMHEEIMTLDAMPLERGMAMVRWYASSHYILLRTVDQALSVQHIKAAWAAHYRHEEKELAFSRERGEQRALWLVPLIRWSSSAVVSVGVAATVWMLRFS